MTKLETECMEALQVYSNAILAIVRTFVVPQDPASFSPGQRAALKLLERATDVVLNSKEIQRIAGEDNETE